MTRRYLSASAVLIAVVLSVLGYAVFGAKTHKVLAQGTPPVGSYGFLVNRSAVAPSPALERSA